jgi:hypothetical protein
VPIISAKNQPLSPLAGQPDFGGQQLAEQLRAESEEGRRRKLLGLGARTKPGGQPSILSPATTSLFQTLGLR